MLEFYLAQASSMQIFYDIYGLPYLTFTEGEGSTRLTSLY